MKCLQCVYLFLGIVKYCCDVFENAHVYLS